MSINCDNNSCNVQITTKLSVIETIFKGWDILHRNKV